MGDFERTFDVNVTIRVTVRDDGDAEDNAREKVNYLMKTIDNRIDDYEINEIEER